MTLATVTELAVKRAPGPEESTWPLPSARTKGRLAKQIDEMDRTINDLTSRMEVLERRLSLLADKLLDRKAN